MQSCLYRGQVRHRRYTDKPHNFRYSLFMTYLDLAEVDTVFRGRWLWSSRRAAPAWFRRADYLGDPQVPLDTAVRDLVEQRTGARPEGPIRLLTHLRYFGMVMNPVNVYFVFDATGETIESLVLEVTNTPWRERHAYVLHAGERRGAGTAYRFDKRFHVSPFLPMNYEYRCVVSDPGDSLVFHLENWRDGYKAFDATLSLRRRAIGTASLAAALAAFPCMTAKVAAGIYWEALRLWWKGATYYPHPSRLHATKENPQS
ncbi:MAG: DUF1365 family protein [Candidatus Hydrogenedens sp.]|nr:DUF1365 family protein [Candidatus Hydrogenedens sp.]